jgi:hypothetical protein
MNWSQAAVAVCQMRTSATVTVDGSSLSACGVLLGKGSGRRREGTGTVGLDQLPTFSPGEDYQSTERRRRYGPPHGIAGAESQIRDSLQDGD